MKLALPHKMAQSLSQKLEKIYCEWTSDYPDIPWMTQELRIPVDAGMTSVVFHCVFTQLAQVPDVELVFRSGVDSKSSEVTLEWQVPEGAPGLLLTLNGVDSRALEALVFRQKRDAICRSAMVCLQQDMVSGEWLVLYNSLERGKALESLIKSRLKDLAPPVAKAVEAYLSSMLNGDFKLAASHFHTAKADGDFPTAKQCTRYEAGFQILDARGKARLHAKGTGHCGGNPKSHRQGMHQRGSHSWLSARGAVVGA
jgi:hypothetical protein